MSVDSDVFIIGAGPAGLTAAYCLTKESPSVTVIEMDPHYVGGISRTVAYKDFRFDIGGHRFFSKAKEVVDLWHEILPDDFIERPRLSRIYYSDKYFDYPLPTVVASLRAQHGRAITTFSTSPRANCRSTPSPGPKTTCPCPTSPRRRLPSGPAPP